MSGRPTARAVRGWATEVDAVAARIGPRFTRREPRAPAAGYVRGLLGDAERKSGWHLAEALGEATPDGVQHLLARAAWDADAARDDLLAYVGEHLGTPDGVLVVDETGFLEKGAKSVGVARQYSGTAGRIENGQVGVFLGYVTAEGRALVDRALYPPKEWADDVGRRAEAGVPTAVAFATGLEPARRMVERAVAAGVPARWGAGDAVSGSAYTFRAALERRGRGCVLGVRTDQAVCVGGRQVRARALLAEVPAVGWRRLSGGAGSNGPRLYDWAVCPVNGPDPRRYARWLLIRRSVADPAEVAYFLCGGPPRTGLTEPVRVAGSRGAVGECSELAGGECGLDECEVRSWTGWRRHVTVSLWALAVVAAVRSRAAGPPGKRGRRA